MQIALTGMAVEQYLAAVGSVEVEFEITPILVGPGMVFQAGHIGSAQKMGHTQRIVGPELEVTTI